MASPSLLLLTILAWHGQALAGQLTLIWANTSTNELGFSVERSTGTTGTFAEIGTTGAGVTAYTDATVADATTYCYRVQAYNATAYSGYSNIACATTAQASGLAVVKMGAGSGTVISTPSGIICGGTCAATYATGRAVTLTATAETGSTFTGWSGGGCSGTGSCTVTVSSTTTVRATFALQSVGLTAAVLPGSRAVQVDTPATAYATVINTGSVTATACSIAPVTSLPAEFSYQTTDPATNEVAGTPNTPADIPAGAVQTFVFTFTPRTPFPPTDIVLSFACANTGPAPVIPGLNTLLLSASATPMPDIVALAVTLNNDGIVNIPSVSSTGVFSVATVNVGLGAPMTVSADTGGASLPVDIQLCQTDPTTSQCISAVGPTLISEIDANATPTFGVFVTAAGAVPFDPANNRIFVRFTELGGVTRGETSVAVRTQE